MTGATTWDAAAIVAVAAVVATVVVAVANLIFLGLNARATRRHEVAMQHSARTQARSAETYLAFVMMMDRVRGWATHDITPGPVPPDPIADREVSETRARLRTFGSSEVVDAADRWGDALSAVTDAITLGDRDRAETLLGDLAAREQDVRRLIRDELSGA